MYLSRTDGCVAPTEGFGCLVALLLRSVARVLRLGASPVVLAPGLPDRFGSLGAKRCQEACVVGA